jgi:hypothetical protein
MRIITGILILLLHISAIAQPDNFLNVDSALYRKHHVAAKYTYYKPWTKPLVVQLYYPNGKIKLDANLSQEGDTMDWTWYWYDSVGNMARSERHRFDMYGKIVTTYTYTKGACIAVSRQLPPVDYNLSEQKDSTYYSYNGDGKPDTTISTHYSKRKEYNVGEIHVAGDGILSFGSQDTVFYVYSGDTTFVHTSHEWSVLEKSYTIKDKNGNDIVWMWARGEEPFRAGSASVYDRKNRLHSTTYLLADGPAASKYSYRYNSKDLLKREENVGGGPYVKTYRYSFYR